MSVLERILAYKRDEVAARKRALPHADLDAAIRKQTRPRGFTRALRAQDDHPALIAEIKKASPSKGLIRANFDPSDRYVLSLPGTGRYRLRADASGYGNLALAGDWIDSSLNASLASP